MRKREKKERKEKMKMKKEKMKGNRMRRIKGRNGEERGGFTVSGSEEFDLENDSDVGGGIGGSEGERPRVRGDSDGNEVDENGDYVDEELRARSTDWNGWYI
ncbi:hypothetical protein AOL_s00043g559 [Orbilia oligospora ATCC 24927]|uniref:Uncharacterized protein n=1 Tax=Arthrobotrys oligospora (strain ATCC 24927 / CBS 115.81 / DSM 1491) TaxID=756982 RepID=G1X4D5_ARTOA|nr:hypothetical protein AOL_s00043g559 [Orbilia oligospora ATCC 24927]EGX51825.1 hypothetical protein AOL_s00043g559 [Orbilia oligospora ATCC 24927]